jgi:peptidyl-prolyl cis-trans isomerase A (cyclophilin A)
MRRSWSLLPVLAIACTPPPAPPASSSDLPAAPTASVDTSRTPPAVAPAGTETRSAAPATAAPSADASASMAASPSPPASVAARAVAAVADPPPTTRPLPPMPVFDPTIKAKPVKALPPSPDDPLQGKFSLAEATKGLPTKGTLVAEIDTTLGIITCRLLETQAPRTVANFVGLARGVRPFLDPQTGQWTTRPAYDGTTFHRVIPSFMIQGGDPSGTGRGEPGYVIPDEVWAGGAHNQPGLLCAANRGPDTNGLQFFVTDGVSPHLDNGFTIFGVCAPVETIHEIASVPRGRADRPTSPVVLRSVRIHRAP